MTDQVIRRLFKARKHQHRILHLLHAESCDPQDLALVGHHVTQKHHVSRIDAHPVRLHGVLDLVVDCRTRGFDAQDFCGLHDVVGLRAQTINAYLLLAADSVKDRVDLPSVPMTSASP